MIQDLKLRKGRPLDRAYLIEAFELCLINAQAYARFHWRYADLLNLRIVMNIYKTVSDYIHRDDDDDTPETVLGRRRELAEELVAKSLPYLTDKQVARLSVKLTEIAENDTSEKLRADILRWVKDSI